ncbi:SGNH/GDSL hydrolase family protein [Enterovirga aerilata]|uniref:SGNH/GDSL hydrolase family protein n=1 Tax=Enterovirga aerilata TaxID=2730920 RepID=A0A849IFG3_9HYPH|nr:SGNH/GDSL hydrolase family protein [Enterovirga sp. DB1703]NNM74965.1 SGNH/GDSL hydrolase family protein [Enterovirga sp. DB1703]
MRLLAAACAAAPALVAAIGTAPARASDEACGAERAALSRPASFRSLTEGLASDKPVRLLAIGSSSTEGVGASAPARSYPAQLERELRAAWSGRRVEVVNAGIGGETADQTLARLERLMAEPAKPALVLWQVGTNDALAGGDEARFRSLLERGISLVRAAGSDLVIVDQQFFPRIADPGRYERYVAMVNAVAGEHGIPVFSRYRLMKLWAERDPALLDRMLSADGFHMGDLGYRCMADALGRNVAESVARTVQTRGIVVEPRPASATTVAQIRG